MDDRKMKFKLAVAHAKCANCGMERILYFTSNDLYGERIVSTKSGKLCAYANLLSENIIQELENMCTEVYFKSGVSISSSKLARIVSSIYGITCDDINGEQIDTISNTKCPYCLERKLIEDDKWGEQLMEIEVFEVMHDFWGKLEYKEKIEKVKGELIRQGYLV